MSLTDKIKKIVAGAMLLGALSKPVSAGDITGSTEFARLKTDYGMSTQSTTSLSLPEQTDIMHVKDYNSQFDKLRVQTYPIKLSDELRLGVAAQTVMGKGARGIGLRYQKLFKDKFGKLDYRVFPKSIDFTGVCAAPDWSLVVLGGQDKKSKFSYVTPTFLKKLGKHWAVGVEGKFAGHGFKHLKKSYVTPKITYTRKF